MDKDGKAYATCGYAVAVPGNSGDSGSSGKAVSTYNSGGNAGTNQKQVMYWEDKNTGQYIRQTVTQKSNPNEYRQYDTTTVGNKSTGEYQVKQSQQVYKNNDYHQTGYARLGGSDGSGYYD